MPWTPVDYPPSWKNLTDEVRDKAIEIANALVTDGLEEGRAIPIALSQARKTLGETTEKDQWVLPHEEGWAVRSEDVERPRKVYDTQAEAIDAAVDFAKRHEVTVTVLRQDGTIRDRQSFKPRL